MDEELYELLKQKRKVEAIKYIGNKYEMDYKTSKDILSLLQRINKEYETTIILATHNEEITKMSNITIRLKDGVICQEIENYKIMDAQELEW